MALNGNILACRIGGSLWGGGRLRELVALGRLTVPERYKLLYKIFKCPWEHLYCYYFLKMVHPDRFDCSLSLLSQGGFPLPRNFYVCTWLCKIYVRNVWKVLPGKRKSWTLVNFTFKRHTSFLASVIYASKIYVGINNLCWESVKSVTAYCKGLKSNSRKLRKSDGKITMLDWGWRSFGSTIPPSLPGFDWEIDRVRVIGILLYLF